MAKKVNQSKSIFKRQANDMVIKIEPFKSGFKKQSSDMAVKAKPSKTGFNDLPYEIRHMIWSHVLLIPPRIVYVTLCDYFGVELNERRSLRVWPVLTSLNREARAFALHYYKLHSGTRCSERALCLCPNLVISPQLDIFSYSAIQSRRRRHHGLIAPILAQKLLFDIYDLCDLWPEGKLAHLKACHPEAKEILVLKSVYRDKNLPRDQLLDCTVKVVEGDKIWQTVRSRFVRCTWNDLVVPLVANMLFDRTEEWKRLSGLDLKIVDFALPKPEQENWVSYPEGHSTGTGDSEPGVMHPSEAEFEEDASKEEESEADFDEAA